VAAVDEHAGRLDVSGAPVVPRLGNTGVTPLSGITEPANFAPTTSKRARNEVTRARVSGRFGGCVYWGRNWRSARNINAIFVTIDCLASRHCPGMKCEADDFGRLPEAARSCPMVQPAPARSISSRAAACPCASLTRAHTHQTPKYIARASFIGFDRLVLDHFIISGHHSFELIRRIFWGHGAY
jgi:hypothetical protein